MKIQTLGLQPPEQRNITTQPVISRLSTWGEMSTNQRTDPGELITPVTCLQSVYCNAAIKLISESIATCSPRLYINTGNRKQLAVSNNLYKLLTATPSTDGTAFTLWSSFVSDILRYGNGFIEIQRNNVGSPIGLWLLPAYGIEIVRLDSGLLGYKTSFGINGSRTLASADVIHCSIGARDGVVGVSPVSECRNAIAASLAAERYMGHVWGNNATPSGVLKSKKTIKADDKVSMRRDWELMQGGSNNGRTAVLDLDLDYQPISRTAADMQWLESEVLSRSKIASIFKVHPSMIGDTTRVSATTAEQQALELVTLTLNPHLIRIQQALEAKLLVGLPQYSIEWDTSALLKPDEKSQLESYKSAIAAGIFTVNEIRAKLGYNPSDDPAADKLVIQVNMTSLEHAVNTIPVATTPDKNRTTTEADGAN